ncbi:MAG: hypothetical protein HYS89_00870 [Candidatus Colwellbacteria bacterium]|nr:hypothetical protein [Candidatus Colwellbacteria bacterium]
MDIPFRYAYAALTIPFIAVWLILFIFSKNTRKEQLILSSLFAPLGPISELIYFRDYWLPQSIWPFSFGTFPFMIEDLVFAFVIAGIGGVIYEAVLRKRLASTGARLPRRIRPFIIALLGIATMFFLLKMGINSIYASSAAFLVIALLIIANRRDLLADALGSGVGVMLIMFLSYFLLSNVIVKNTDQLLMQAWLIYGEPIAIRFLGIPLTEMIWGFTWGLVIGPLYEFLRKMRVV